MANSESEVKANLIYDKLNSIQNEGKTRDEEIKLIQEVLEELIQEQRMVGRREIIAHLKTEIEFLDKF